MCLVPRGARGHPGMSQLPHCCAQTQEQGGGSPKVPFRVSGVRRLHLPRPCPHPLSKRPIPPSVTFGGRSREDPIPVPHHASSPTQHHQPKRGQWVPGSSRNPGSNLTQGPWAGQWDWRRLVGGPASAPHVAGGAGGEQGDASLGVPRSRGSVGAKHLRDGSALSATQTLSSPNPPPHPGFRDVPGKGPPAPTLASAVQ